MYTGYNVFGLRVDTTNHVDDRLYNRNISIYDIISTLEQHPGIKKYNDTGQELCIRSKKLSLFLEVRLNKVVLVTALDRYAKYVKEAIVV